MYIWRVENKNGNGCYKDKTLSSILRNHRISKKRPSPLRDKGIERGLLQEEICGFLNLSQALTWFTTDELNSLRKLGYELSKIKVRKITAIGERQVLAIR